jgi:fimbrial chaperone protein
MRNLVIGAATMFAAAAPLAASATTIVIWPVDPVIKPGDQATSLWLENTGSEPVTLQVRSFGWSQPDGKDALDSQDMVVASPPIATVQAGRRQLVRVIRRPSATAAAAAPESSYRLIVDELPTASTAAGADRMSARLAVQMRYSIPLFVYSAPADAQQPHLVTSYRIGSQGREIEIRNTGTGHARLSDVRLVTAGKELMVKPGLAGYVLPGATVHFALPAGNLGTVKVGVNGRDETLLPDA